MTHLRVRTFTLARMLALGLALVLGFSLAALPGPGQPPASAYTPGSMIDFNGWPVGTFQLANGQFVYCIEPGADPPQLTQQSAEVVDELRGYSVDMSDVTGWSGRVSTTPISGEPLRRINYVLSAHGDTQNADTAVAVQFAIWMLRQGAGEAAWLNHHISWVEQHGGAGHISQARALAAEAIASALPPSTPSPAGLQLREDGRFGEGVVAYPLGATELRITGGTFADGTTVLSLDGSAAGEVRWSADLHPNGWQRLHQVRVSGSWSLPSHGWPAQLEIYPSLVPEEQTLTWSVGAVTETHVGEWEPVELMIDTQFSPVLTTQVVERWIPRESAPFADTVTLSQGEGSAPWAQRVTEGGNLVYAPIVANGVIYGPFNRPQTPSVTVPAGAPVAGTAQLLAQRGPGTYEIVSTQMSDESGYYYWVWEIEESAQVAEVRAAQLIPQGYLFRDEFGLVEEGHVTPTRLSWATELVSNELTLDHMHLTDRVTVTLHGGAWLRDETGKRIPARIRLSVYGSTDQPRQQSEVPEGAEVIAQGFVEVNAPNRMVTSDPISLPSSTRGWVTIRACLVAEDQPEEWRGYIEEWCDDYGVPAETARIVEPEALATTGGAGTGGLVTGGIAVFAAGAALLTISRVRRL
ncbi:hypothetical protein [Leucobacter sp. W1478]|uniref:hypothetical protein n=1 Tax=Leucobacter sp. W1478 TaxID=3439065 RepID=UPI003F2C66CF